MIDPPKGTEVDANGLDIFLREQFKKFHTLKREEVSFRKDGREHRVRTYYSNGRKLARGVYQRTLVVTSDPWVAISGVIFNNQDGATQ